MVRLLAKTFLMKSLVKQIDHPHLFFQVFPNISFTLLFASQHTTLHVDYALFLAHQCTCKSSYSMHKIHQDNIKQEKKQFD